mmetsp:Transcript_13139/g.22209  ORF Transcript_13139/g.22209 Transcript_13139/m.22209 type:complete len:196 (-) Transcript_13139:407-994(-)
MENLNGQPLDGREIRVEYSGPGPAGGPGGAGAGTGEANTVFVGNLGFRTEEWSIREFFSGCGDITSVRIAMGEDGRARGFAHVEFAQPSSATQAMNLNGQELDGRGVRLDLSVPRQGGGRGGRGGDRGGRGFGGRGGGFGGRGGDRGGRGFGGRGGGFGGRGGDRGRGGRGGFNPQAAAANRGSIVRFEGKREML